MASFQNQLNINEEFRTLKIIFYSLAAVQIIFFILCIYLNGKGAVGIEKGISNSLKFIFSMLILINILSSKFIYNKRVRSADKSVELSKKISSYKINNIIKWAFLESANLLTAAAFLLTGYFLYAVLFLIIIALFFINGPGEDKFILEYDLTPDEIRFFQNKTM